MVLISGPVLGGIIVLRPRVFWAMLIALASGTGGLVLGGYGIVDDYLIGSVAVGGLLALFLRNKVRLLRKGSCVHFYLFSLMMIYFIFQGIRGAIILEDWRIIRFVLLFGAILLVALVSRSSLFARPAPDTVNKILVLSTMTYLIFYLGFGLYSEAVLHMSRFARQGQDWSGSAYALFPLAVALPAGLLFMKEGKLDRILGGGVFLALSALAAGYYDSRVTTFLIVAFLLTSPMIIGFRRAGVLFFVAAMALLAGFSTIYKELAAKAFISSIYAVVRAAFNSIWTPSESSVQDLDRILQLHGAVSLIANHPLRLVFGDGFWVHRFSLNGAFGTFYRETIIRTTAFSGFIVDTGIIGLLLLIGSVMMVIWEILSCNVAAKTKVCVILGLVMINAWWTVSNVIDFTLYYMCIMPYGIFRQMINDRHAATDSLQDKGGRSRLACRRKTRRGGQAPNMPDLYRPGRLAFEPGCDYVDLAERSDKPVKG